MSDQDLLAFEDLLREAFLRCFGTWLDNQVSESESRHWSNDIEEKTGLVVGWKSLKNYVAFLLADTPEKMVNPTVATLDTLARYVSGAPVTTEIQRKKGESHYPYWFRYREKYAGESAYPVFKKTQPRPFLWTPVLITVAVLAFAVYFYFKPPTSSRIAEDFQSVEENHLFEQGWMLQSRESIFWNKRGDTPGQLTLFTLPGDNWPKSDQEPRIRNLLLRNIPDACFSTEVHFSDFIPRQNWQQAGLLLLEDTAFAGKSIRLSLAYNNFFGGYPKPGEIIMQGVASYGKEYLNLEEIVHQPLFTLTASDSNSIVANNLQYSAVRIEKQGGVFRFLYAVSPTENFSFKELAVYPFDMKPRFVGVFALHGLVDSVEAIPVGVRFFRLEGMDCN